MLGTSKMYLAFLFKVKHGQHRRDKKKWEKEDDLNWEKEDDLKAYERRAKAVLRVMYATLVNVVYEMHEQVKEYAAKPSDDLKNVNWLNFDWSKKCLSWWSVYEIYDLVDFDLARLTRVLDREEQRELLKDLDKRAKDLVHFAVFHRKATADKRYKEWVVAIRGTAWYRDGLSDLKIIFETFHTSSLVKLLEKTVERLCKDYGPENVTVTGHSLGAAARMHVGRNMAVKYKYYLDAHLFNPPFVQWETLLRSVTIRIHPYYLMVPEKVYGIVTNVRDKISDNIFEFLDKEQYQKLKEEFWALSDWKPHLYVNMNDPICSEYAYYFRHYKDHPMFYSLVNVFRRVLFRCEDTSHLIPKAILCLDTTRCGLKVIANPLKPHKLKNWMASDPSELCYKVI
ncbi:hypothetical protein MPTK1_2g18880 [Marchantia polymorpha subsp. ruderalis]|uniref:Uncharacterized protein n=1 Tax=Marchantia polymorpha TaxID=3197 RepID=A0A2R6W8N1_MARPO|nr:hypothetical protein MARPO_0128s0003 [Marchantia polymorpha]BBN02876.1 hypothetical protein Mp_2g18880 [Marchantia polymorpha subsp. ruderalis]|eukprot:PTQ30179.1 hypothetical protein MARPO_0128s0003 [Marchantia polymorpha]